jgi:hypothetical protein
MPSEERLHPDYKTTLELGWENAFWVEEDENVADEVRWLVREAEMEVACRCASKQAAELIARLLNLFWVRTDLETGEYEGGSRVASALLHLSDLAHLYADNHEDEDMDRVRGAFFTLRKALDITDEEMQKART